MSVQSEYDIYLPLGFDTLFLFLGALSNALATPQFSSHSEVRKGHRSDGEYVRHHQDHDVVSVRRNMYHLMADTLNGIYQYIVS
ncbi:hypothetical protein NPIL_472221 [Nephila pilipes]|uniref:Uncharacterized protein n=1 Tax=Nephila pilipes TaxID=299642 RepID=A0A8X6UID3_NEPPI|nr:hypothetical protein NPIL_472221 [Nephila pilipes]